MAISVQEAHEGLAKENERRTFCSLLATPALGSQLVAHIFSLIVRRARGNHCDLVFSWPAFGLEKIFLPTW